jgi:uncharacterized membrane protein YhhN
MQLSIWLLLYCTASLLSASTHFYGSEWSDWVLFVSKPLLMPLLYGCITILGTQKARLSYFLSSGLFFAWLGDVLLLFADDNLLFFIAGLGAFLLMQIQYIVRYRKKRLPERKPSFQLVFIRSGLPLFTAALFYYLAFPMLDFTLKIGVAIYALALAGMVTTAANRYGRSNGKSFWWVLIGATLFMVSDLIIGLNRFVQPIPYAGFWILLSYTLGQFLILSGLQAHSKD